MTGNVSDERAIENLIASYTFLVDDGDFAGLGELFTYCEFVLAGRKPVIGREAVETFLRNTLRTYEDGTPRTRHVSSNIIIEIDETGNAASARSYGTVFQSTEGFSLQPIACSRYNDRFERRGGRWVFTFREATTGLAGDFSRHLR